MGFRGLGLGHRGLGLARPLSKTWIQQGLTASMGTFVEAGVFQKGGRGVWPGGVDAIKDNGKENGNCRDYRDYIGVKYRGII